MNVMEVKSSKPRYYRLTDDRKRGHGGMIKCPYCGKKVKPIQYGNGWIGLCCDNIVYNSPNLPEYDSDCPEMEHKRRG
ncbi:MAG: hypothetical protein C0392_12865 [Syntrophus sp. (in: bacteria)]|nr:hypothetical protein [Syntrophus sp. (in: bacteria)]